MVEVIAAKKHYEVTREQMSMCERVTDLATGAVFYQVKSATRPGKVYDVRYHKEFGKLSCTCEAGVYYPTCWHRRAATACELEYKHLKRVAAKRQAEEIERTAQHQREQAEQALAQADRELRDLERAASKREQSAVKRYGAKAYESKPFSLLK